MAANSGIANRGGRAQLRASLGLLFIGSGCAALIYEVVWFQLLRLVIGGSSISLGILLASFMGGMCLGSLAGPWAVPARFHPLRVYAALELAIGIFGCTLPWWLPLLADWYIRLAGYSFAGIGARAIVAGVCILPSTILMGATLPVVARWVKATPDGLAQMGLFYGANTFGAVLGCLAAGFVFLPQTDVIVSSYVAAGINLLVAVAAFMLARKLTYDPPISPEDRPDLERRNAPLAVCLIIGLSGFAALSAEVVWTRLMASLFGPTVYAFAIILAVVLAGIGIGSTLAAKWVAKTRFPLRWLALCQLAIACLTPYANYMITRVIPFWKRPTIDGANQVYAIFQHDTLRATAAVLPSAILWGASFPLALALVGLGPRQRDASRQVSQVYAANTLGAIIGALLTSAVFVPLVGSQRSQQIIVLVSGLAATLSIYARNSEFETKPASSSRHGKRRKESKPPSDGTMTRLDRFGPPVVILAATLLVTAPPHGMLARALYPDNWFDVLTDVYEQEGRTSQVVVQQHNSLPYRYLCVGGKVEASNIRTDIRCQRLLGHLPALIHPAPKKTLTVGLGTGITAGSFVLYPEIEQMTICEIEPAVKDAAGNFFAKENHDVVKDPRTTIVFDDARHFLAATQEKFDVITSDPVNPWVRGAAALYTAEYYELCKKHLNPGGVVVQWIPLYESDTATAKCELATFINAFPSVTLWNSLKVGDEGTPGPDIIAVGQVEPTTIDLQEIQRRINGNPRLKASLEEVDIGTVGELMGQFAGRGADLKPWLKGVEINRDASLRLEYLAGLSVFVNQSLDTFAQVTKYLKYPHDLLKGDAEYENEIRIRLGLPATAD